MLGSVLASGGASAAWEMIDRDMLCALAVFDDELNLRYMNRAAEQLLGAPRAAAMANGVAGFFPAEFSRERAEHIAAVIESGEARILIGLLRGCWCRSVIRPTQLQDGRRGALVVCSRILDPWTVGVGGPPLPRVYLNTADLGPLASLSRREIEVLRLIGRGLGLNSIARAIHRSMKTVATHRLSLGRKLGATNLLELARISIYAGLPGMTEDEVSMLVAGRAPARAAEIAARLGTGAVASGGPDGCADGADSSPCPCVEG